MSGRPATNQRTHSRAWILGDRYNTITTRVKLPGGKVLTGTIQDISAGGASILGDTENLAVDGVVTITLARPPNDRDIRRCRVKRIEPGRGFDVAFLN